MSYADIVRHEGQRVVSAAYEIGRRNAPVSDTELVEFHEELRHLITQLSAELDVITCELDKRHAQSIKTDQLLLEKGYLEELEIPQAPIRNLARVSQQIAEFEAGEKARMSVSVGAIRQRIAKGLYACAEISGPDCLFSGIDADGNALFVDAPAGIASTCPTMLVHLPDDLLVEYVMEIGPFAYYSFVQ